MGIRLFRVLTILGVQTAMETEPSYKLFKSCWCRSRTKYATHSSAVQHHAFSSNAWYRVFAALQCRGQLSLQFTMQVTHHYHVQSTFSSAEEAASSTL
jgi:hypothetical protein